MSIYLKQTIGLIILSLFCTLLLSSCKMSSPLELLYFQRVKFSFIDDDKENKIIYLCSKEKTEEETRKKADEANNFYKVEFDKLVNGFTDNLFKQFNESTAEDKKNDLSWVDSISSSLDLSKKSEELVTQVESKYQCLLIDIIEIK